MLVVSPSQTLRTIGGATETPNGRINAPFSDQLSTENGPPRSFLPKKVLRKGHREKQLKAARGVTSLCVAAARHESQKITP